MIEGYRKNKGTVEIRAAGSGTIHLYTPRYNPATGERLDDGFSQLHLSGFENELKIAQANIDKAIEYKADLEAFMKDAEKADATFNEAAKKAKKE